jgi:hypothetical protein
MASMVYDEKDLDFLKLLKLLPSALVPWRSSNIVVALGVHYFSLLV